MRGRAAVYATNPNSLPYTPYTPHPPSADFNGLEGVVIIDVNHQGYYVSGISFPFSRGDKGWKIDEPVYIGPYSNEPDERFTNNFNNQAVALGCWKSARQKGHYREEQINISNPSNPDESYMALPQRYMMIPTSEFLSDNRKEIVNVVNGIIQGNLDDIVRRLKLHEEFIVRKKDYLDEYNLPPSIVHPGNGRMRLAISGNMHSIFKRTVQTYNH